LRDGTCHLGLPELLEIRERARYDAYLLVLHTHQFVERRHCFELKTHLSKVENQTKSNNFPWRRFGSKDQNMFCDESLVSPCLEGSLAKAACNDDSFCCNMLDLL